MSKKAVGAKKIKVWQLVVLLFAVVFGMVLFVMAVAGWFSNEKVVLDEEYICADNCEPEFMELSATEYEELAEEKKSFVVFVDQGGCHTADRLREYVLNYVTVRGIKVYRMMFSQMKETSLYESVRYYPSVAIISRGQAMGWLRADADEDSDAYNEYGAFENWIKRWLK